MGLAAAKEEYDLRPHDAVDFKPVDPIVPAVLAMISLIETLVRALTCERLAL